MSYAEHAWIGVDLDGTLAKRRVPFDGEIGEPIMAMVERVKRWLAMGRKVRIMTARVGCCGMTNPEGTRDDEHWAADQRLKIKLWCIEHLGQAIPVTATKDLYMIALWDDLAISVEADTGRITTEGFPESY